MFHSSTLSAVNHNQLMLLEHLPGAVIDIKKIGEQIYPSMKYKNLKYKSEIQTEDQLT